jgi:hypothetical protein
MNCDSDGTIVGVKGTFVAFSQSLLIEQTVIDLWSFRDISRGVNCDFSVPRESKEERTILDTS